jgi:GT2 family glycosyltransferase
MPNVSIIIVNFNGKEHLSDCLNSIYNQTYQDFEIILVDNNSVDDSVELILANYPEVILLKQNKNLGFCEGNNTGASHSSGEYILLLNNDTKMEKDCLENLVKIMQASDKMTIGIFPKVKFFYNRRIINAMGTQWHIRTHWRDFRIGMFDFESHKEAFQVFGSIFPVVLLKKNIFFEIGMFDPAFFASCEDFDLCYRANIMGYKFFVEPKAIVDHKYRATTVSLLKPHWHHYLFIRNYLMVFLKNYELKNLVKFFPYALYRYAIKGFINSLKSIDLKYIYIYIRLIIYLILKSPYWFRKRREVQQKRVIDDKSIWSESQIEEFNLFNFKGKFVYSLLNLRASKDENLYYELNNTRYTIK